MATKKYLTATSQQPTAAQLLQKWRRKFKEGGIDDYNLSAKYLVEYICGRETVKVVFIYWHSDKQHREGPSLT